MKVDTRDFVSITDLRGGRLGDVLHMAEKNGEVIVLRNNKPVCAVVSLARLEKIKETEAA